MKLNSIIISAFLVCGCLTDRNIKHEVVLGSFPETISTATLCQTVWVLTKWKYNISIRLFSDVAYLRVVKIYGENIINFADTLHLDSTGSCRKWKNEMITQSISCDSLEMSAKQYIGKISEFYYYKEPYIEIIDPLVGTKFIAVLDTITSAIKYGAFL